MPAPERKISNVLLANAVVETQNIAQTMNTLLESWQAKIEAPSAVIGGFMNARRGAAIDVKRWLPHHENPGAC